MGNETSTLDVFLEQGFGSSNFIWMHYQIPGSPKERITVGRSSSGNRQISETITKGLTEVVQKARNSQLPLAFEKIVIHNGHKDGCVAYDGTNDEVLFEKLPRWDYDEIHSLVEKLQSKDYYGARVLRRIL